MRVIVLNQDFSFHQTTDWRGAFSLIRREKAEVVKESDKFVRTSEGSKIIIPAILKLINFVAFICRYIEYVYSK